MTGTFFYGPCWCGGDSTTGGHQHGVSGDGNDTIIDTQQEAVLVELRAIRQLLEALAGVGEETPCKGCGGRGWYEGVEPDPRDQTGMTPMQVQIQCPCEGKGKP